MDGAATSQRQRLQPADRPPARANCLKLGIAHLALNML